MSKCYIHTRHIPKEHINLETPMGKRILQNGLLDILESGERAEEFGKVVFDIREDSVYETLLPVGKLFYKPSENRIYTE